MRPEIWYGWLVRLYPKTFRERFGAGMVQTFIDLHRERPATGRSEFAFCSWMFAETSASIVKENIAMIAISTQQLRLSAMASAGLLTVPLILTLANPASRLRGGEGGGFDWMPGSFLVMGVLLFAVCLGVQIAASRLSKPAHRVIAISGIALLFALVWAELAVDGVSQAAMFLA